MGALKVFLNDFKGLKITFPRLRSTREGPENIKHKAYSKEELAEIMDIASNDKAINALVRFLYDAGARIQDIVGLKVDPFIKEI